MCPRLVGISGYVESDGGNDLFMRVWSKYITLHNNFNCLKHQNLDLTSVIIWVLCTNLHDLHLNLY